MARQTYITMPNPDLSMSKGSAIRKKATTKQKTTERKASERIRPETDGDKLSQTCAHQSYSGDFRCARSCWWTPDDRAEVARKFASICRQSILIVPSNSQRVTRAKLRQEIAGPRVHATYHRPPNGSHHLRIARENDEAAENDATKAIEDLAVQARLPAPVV